MRFTTSRHAKVRRELNTKAHDLRSSGLQEFHPTGLPTQTSAPRGEGLLHSDMSVKDPGGVVPPSRVQTLLTCLRIRSAGALRIGDFVGLAQ